MLLLLTKFNPLTEAIVAKDQRFLLLQTHANTVRKNRQTYKKTTAIFMPEFFGDGGKREMKKRGVYWTHYKSSYTQKLKWLRKNKVITKKGGVKKSTVERLYSFYHRNPLSTPRNLAYGYPQRIEKSIEKQQDIETPKGRITAKKYRKRQLKTLDKQIASQLGHGVTYRPNIKTKAFKRVQNHILYHFPHNQYVAVKLSTGKNNVGKMMNRANKEIFPVLKKDITLFINTKSGKYKTMLLQIWMHFKMEDFNGIVTDHHKIVPFANIKRQTIDSFLQWYFHQMTTCVEDTMLEGFKLCLTPSGEAGSHLIAIMLYFSTDKQATDYDMLGL